MSGVEAAASLFGGTESEDRDLFSTLGGNTTSPENNQDDLFGSSAQDSTFLQQENDVFNDIAYNAVSTAGPEPVEPPSHPATYNYQPSAPVQNTYQAPSTGASIYEPAHQYTPTPAAPAENSWNQQSLYSTPSASNTYTPSTYSTPATSHYASYNPTSYTPASSYAPAPSAPVANVQPPARSAYDPPPAHYAATTARYETSPYNYGSNATTTPSNYGAMKPPSVAPPAPPAVTPTAALNRPKVSNAYDPPFLTSTSSRKSSRTAGLPAAHSIYAQQTPAHPVAPPPQTLYAPNYQTPLTGPIKHTPIAPERPPSQNYSARYSPVQPPVHNNVTSYDVKPTMPPPPANGHSASTHDIFGDIHAQYRPSESSGTDHAPVQASRNEVYDTGRPPSIPPPSTTPSHTEATHLSPSLVPLPYSPPTMEAELHHQTPPTKYTEPDIQSYAAPSQAPLTSPPKKEPAKEAYVPKLPYNANNYIPRTSSPLSLYNGTPQHEQKPVPASSNFNGARASPYDPPPRPTAGISSSYAPPKIPDAVLSRPPRLEQSKLNAPPTASTYAPSPSLLGTNDPLSRISAHAPVITFGFGGKLITCFHRMAGMNAGFDVALSSRPSSEIKVYTLHKLLPETVLHTNSSFPGPLLSDPGSSSLSLVRANQATQAKAKKAGLISYLSGRASEIDQGLGYLSHAERQRAEAKRTLINLLKVMIENDGKLLGTSQSDTATRQALVPRLESMSSLQDGMSLQASHKPPSLDDPPLSTTILRASALDKIEEFLLQGERRQAYHYAADEKLWAHAFIIASSIDKDSWKEVVSEFLRSEFSSSHGGNNATGPSEQHGREGLKVAYSLFSGQGAAAVQELSSPTLLQKATLRPPMSLAPAVTPRTPNFGSLAVPQVSVQSLYNWAETAAMLISSPLSQEASAALTALGDQLLGHNFVEAAHCCYLLSPQTSTIGGLGSPNTRITLLGTKFPADVLRDPDVLVLSEIWEFAMSLAPPTKNAEPFHGIPHLQAYRLLRAAWLADIGEVQLASRYCEAIAASITQNSPYTTFSLMHSLQVLQQRLTGVFNDKSASWIGGKIAKPSLDSIGGWLEGRFTKLVTGDTDSPSSEVATAKPSEQTFGPFAHYSTISSNTPSARSSPQPRPPQVHQPPQRTSSAMAASSYYAPPAPVERSSSALGYMGQNPSPTSQAPSYTPFSHSATNGHGNGNGNGHGIPAPIDTSAPKDTQEGESETPVQHGGWWHSAGFNDTSKTPTAATFVKLEETTVTESTDGFISLMDDQQLSFGTPSPVSSHHRYQSQPDSGLEDEEDLGFGNAKPKPKVDTETEASGKSANSSAKSSPAPSSPAEKQAAPTQTPSGGGWLSRWWKTSEATPGPVKASLGEESAFYYDKEQKRWVNKKAGGDDAPKPAAPPPPPSRPQTASPSFSGPKATPPAGPPPPRSTSAIDLNAEPPKVPMRIRSNLAPPTESAPSTPTGTRHMGDAPPPSRPRSQASKRSVRSRYVDVFQQEGNGSS